MWALWLAAALCGQQIDFSQLDSQLAALEQDRLIIATRQERLAASIADSERQISAAITTRDQLYRQLRQRLLAYKSLQPTVKTTLLTRATTVDRVLRQMQLLRFMTANDQAILREVEQSQKRLSALREDLLHKKSLFAAMNQDLINREEQLAALRLDTLKVVLAEAGQAPAGAAGEFTANQGRLPWPLTGQVTKTFGKSSDQGGGNSAISHGLTIAAAPGAVVTAIGAGTVIFSGPVPSYDELTIIDHGDNYYSIYGHLSRAALAVGVTVEPRQVVGLVAGARGPDRPALYFELRYNGVPIDPLPWLSPASL